MLVELRFQIVCLAPRVRQFAFERAVARLARLRLGGRFEHHRANLFRRRAPLGYLAGDRAKARARLLLGHRQFFQARV